MTDTERRAILDEITAICRPVLPLQANEITISMAAERWECSWGAAKRILNLAVADGSMEKREARMAGRPCTAYRVVES